MRDEAVSDAVAAIVRALGRLSEEQRLLVIAGVRGLGLWPASPEEAAAEERRRRDRERKAAAVRGASAERGSVSAEAPRKLRGKDPDFRGSSAENGPVSAEAPRNSAEFPSLSLSDSGFISQQSPRIADAQVTTAPPRMPVPAIPDTGAVWPMADDAELHPEWRDAVAMMGLRNIDDMWLSFRAHHIAKGTVTGERGWKALFVDTWARRERGYQSKVASTGRRPRVVQEDSGERAWAPPTAADFEPTGTGGKR
jgi:hypothetical protein